MKKSKKELIFLALEKILPEKRFHEITLDEVAQTAKVGKGTIYRYFEDKEDLFFQLAIRGFDEMCQILEGCPAPKAGEDFFLHLTSTCELISGFFNKRRALLRVINIQEGVVSRLRQNSRERWHEHRQRLVAALGGVLRTGVERGEISSSMNVEVMARLLLSMMRGRWHMFEDNPDERPTIEETVHLFIKGASGI